LAHLALWFNEDAILKFAVVVEKDADGCYVASVPELLGCHTQAKTLNKLMLRVKEAIEAYLEAEEYEPKQGAELVGFQIVEVSARDSTQTNKE
jgi:predicted RNase H-like HicB family nuclease